MKQILALITVLNEDGQQPPTGQPPGIWPPGGQQPPRPDQGLPPFPAHPIVIPPDTVGPGVPTHPIYIPAPPVHPSHPIVIPPDAIAPGVPTHPIYIPPQPDQGLPQPPAGGGGQPPKPDQGLPGQQPGIDNTLPQPQPKPEHPIVIPPAPPISEGDKALVLVITGENEPIWFLIDEQEHLKPPTHPQPKGSGSKSETQSAPGGTKRR